MSLPPKPGGRAGRAGPLRFLWLLRRDILSAQSPRLYGAKMAEYRTPFFRSYVVNDLSLLREMLKRRPQDFPKSPRLVAALAPILGQGVFLADGAEWARQSAMIAPLLQAETARALPHIEEAGQAALARLAEAEGPLALEVFTRHVTADVIFRLMLGRPISDEEAQELLAAFDAYEAGAPMLSLGAIFPSLAGRFPLIGAGPRARARALRKLVARLVARHRLARIRGEAGDDLLSALLGAEDPETGAPFDKVTLVDQVTTLLLAGHETSAAGLAWALYMLALHPEAQAAVAAEADAVLSEAPLDRQAVARLERARDVFRETLRLYPPLPMLVREARQPEHFRNRDIPQGAQMVISPWHLHRHRDHWPDPDGFRPERWQDPAQAEARTQAYMPFGMGPRACPGAGLALAEGTVILAQICREWHLAPAPGRVRPIARLTLRGAPALKLRLERRNSAA